MWLEWTIRLQMPSPETNWMCFLISSPRHHEKQDPTRSGGSPGNPGELDMRHLEGLVRDLIAPSTAQVYATGQRRYLSFCRKSNSNPLPLSENQMCLFVVHLADEGLQHSSIKGYLSAVRRMQIVFGMGDPFVASWTLLECTLRGIKLGQAKRVATHSHPRLPVTPAIL